MKKRSIIITLISILVLVMIAIGGTIGFYFYSLKEVDKNSDEPITFVISKGEYVNTVIKNLKNEGLIKNELALKIYSKMNPGLPQAGSFILKKNMTAKEIYEAIISGKKATFDTVWVTFIEGKRLTNIAEVISNNFNYTSDEVMETLDDKEYVKYLIEKYDFLRDDILDSKIYHPLEGYLFADTYEFMKDISIKGIIERMLDNTKLKLSKFSSEIENSSLNIHEIMTLTSIVELEGARSDDRAGVAGVFYNRLREGWTLGSDVTTYYSVGKDFSESIDRDLNACNGYNTRGTCVKGLPVGPIANFSTESLKATLNPKKHDYMYFVADKNMKTYFTKTDYEHAKKVRELKAQGLWYTYK